MVITDLDLIDHGSWKSFNHMPQTLSFKRERESAPISALNVLLNPQPFPYPTKSFPNLAGLFPKINIIMRLLNAFVSVWTILSSIIPQSNMLDSVPRPPPSFKSGRQNERKPTNQTGETHAALRKRITEELRSVEHITHAIKLRPGIGKSRIHRLVPRDVHPTKYVHKDLRPMFREISRSNRANTIRLPGFACGRTLSVLGRRKRCVISTENHHKNKVRLDMMYKECMKNQDLYHTSRPTMAPFSPRFWGTRVVGPEEFSRLIQSGFGMKFFNQKPLEVMRAPFMPQFLSGTVVGPVMFSRWIEAGFGTRDLMEIMN